MTQRKKMQLFPLMNHSSLNDVSSNLVLLKISHLSLEEIFIIMISILLIDINHGGFVGIFLLKMLI